MARPRHQSRASKTVAAPSNDENRQRSTSIKADDINGIDSSILGGDNTTLAWSSAFNPQQLQPMERHAGRPTDDKFHPLLSPAGWDFLPEFEAESILAMVQNANRPTKRRPRNTVTPPTIYIPSISDDPSSSPSSQKFEQIFINAGGEAVRDIFANDWNADTYFVGGVAYNDLSVVVEGTMSSRLYQSQRVGAFDYDIPVPAGAYELILHFAELNENTTVGVNVFNIELEKRLIFPNVDIVGLIGSPKKALTLETVIDIVDGYLSLSFRSVNGLPTLSAIEIDLVGDHLAHAVAGDYEEVDVDSDGLASVLVDGSQSHTHGVGLDLVAWQWYKDGALVGIGETTTITLPVGEHDIVLKVLDNGGNQNSEAFTITVRASGFPVISALSPNSGDLAGVTLTLIQGFGYDFSSEEIIVRFGAFNISSSNISITNSSQIHILAVPPSEMGIPVSVSVITPAGESNKVSYTYIDRVPIEWSGKVSGYFVDSTTF
jgi:Malectin domain/IPT/TIG domain